MMSTGIIKQEFTFLQAVFECQNQMSRWDRALLLTE